MKKISSISDQIKSSTYSYTGKGTFETVVKKNREKVLKWLEDLVPLQDQISYLDEAENLSFQKRNYTRILTKLFPLEYKEFVSLNILVRDSSQIAFFYKSTYDISALYKLLIEKKYLKYPGKYYKYVEFEVFQKFIITYKDDLTAIGLESSTRQEDIYIQEKTDFEDEYFQVSKDEEKISKEEEKKQNNNKWTNLLLGKIK